MHDIFISPAPGTNALPLSQFGTHPMTVTYSNEHLRSKITYNMIILLKIPFRATFAVIWPHGSVISLWRPTKLYDGHRRALRGRILLCVILALKQKMHFAKNVIHTITHFLF